jgi:hypothetical protein
MYSIILTWFTVVLIENWQHMRISWFKEVWEFVDFKAIGYYIEHNISFGFWFAIIFIVIFKAINFKKNKRLFNEESVDSFRNHMDQVQNDWDERVSSPIYHNFPDNVFHKIMAHKKEDI